MTLIDDTKEKVYICEDCGKLIMTKETENYGNDIFVDSSKCPFCCGGRNSMPTKEIKPIKNHEHLCWNCLGIKEHIHNIEIHSLRYGSAFDGWGVTLQLCDECYSKTNPEWWKLNIKQTKFRESSNCFDKYEYEDEFIQFVDNMPVQSQELFYNSCAKDDRPQLRPSSQVWIDDVMRPVEMRDAYWRGVRDCEDGKVYMNQDV